MKPVRLLLSVLPLLAFCAVSCKDPVPEEPAKVPVREVLLSRTKASVKIGQTITLTAQVLPDNATDKSLTWTSDNEGVARVDAQGVVTGVTEGTARISATAGGKSDRCEVTVLYDGIKATGVKLDSHEMTLKLGTQARLSYAPEPAHTTETASWFSTDENVVTVAADGTLTGVGEGEAVVTVKLGDFEDRCAVKVLGYVYLTLTDPLEKVIPRASFPDRKDTVRVARGETATLQVIVNADKDATGLTPRVLRFAKDGGSGLDVQPGLWWVRKIKCTRHWMNGKVVPPRMRSTPISTCIPIA